MHFSVAPVQFFHSVWMRFVNVILYRFSAHKIQMENPQHANMPLRSYIFGLFILGEMLFYKNQHFRSKQFAYTVCIALPSIASPFHIFVSVF